MPVGGWWIHAWRELVNKECVRASLCKATRNSSQRRSWLPCEPAPLRKGSPPFPRSVPPSAPDLPSLPPSLSLSPFRAEARAGLPAAGHIFRPGIHAVVRDVFFWGGLHIRSYFLGRFWVILFALGVLRRCFCGLDYRLIRGLFPQVILLRASPCKIVLLTA